jgi:hypothetical protein
MHAYKELFILVRFMWTIEVKQRDLDVDCLYSQLSIPHGVDRQSTVTFVSTQRTDQRQSSGVRKSTTQREILEEETARTLVIKVHHHLCKQRQRRQLFTTAQFSCAGSNIQLTQPKPILSTQSSHPTALFGLKNSSTNVVVT